MHTCTGTHAYTHMNTKVHPGAGTHARTHKYEGAPRRRHAHTRAHTQTQRYTQARRYQRPSGTLRCMLSALCFWFLPCTKWQNTARGGVTEAGSHLPPNQALSNSTLLGTPLGRGAAPRGQRSCCVKEWAGPIYLPCHPVPASWVGGGRQGLISAAARGLSPWPAALTMEAAERA